MIDGKNGREMEAIAVRFFYNDLFQEQVIDLVAVKEVLDMWKIS